MKKHFAGIDSRGNRREARKVAREIILDALVQKRDWAPYSGIIAGFAKKNDRDFFEQLVRGVQRKRKPVFGKDEWFLLLNWEEWNSVLPVELVKLPPLRYWTDEAVLGLLERYFEEGEFTLSLSGLRTKRIRLGLKQAKPPKVTGVYPAKDQPGFFCVQTKD